MRRWDSTPNSDTHWTVHREEIMMSSHDGVPEWAAAATRLYIQFAFSSESVCCVIHTNRLQEASQFFLGQEMLMKKWSSRQDPLSPLIKAFHHVFALYLTTGRLTYPSFFRTRLTGTTFDNTSAAVMDVTTAETFLQHLKRQRLIQDVSDSDWMLLPILD
jgi:hypothetical protein